MNSYLIKEKNTCLKRYGVINGGGSKQALDKYKQTCLERYGVKFSSQVNEKKEQISNTWKNKSKEEIDSYIEKRKNTYKTKYGVINQMYIPNVKEKIYNSKKKNNTFNSSKIEKQFEQYLKDNNIDYKTQYKSILYPYCCDFYLPKYDLYIEIQGNWTHGGHPFDCTNEEDQKQLNEWKLKGTGYYTNAIKTWSVKDVQKRETAKNNHLNYLEVFTNDINEILEKLKNLF